MDIKAILEKHDKWLRGEVDGERAILDNQTLDNYDLRGVNLNRASLDGASLDGASLNGASLDGASLNRAYLDGASLNRASLNRASLIGASLDGASLDGASLNGASLDGASLDGAYLDGASLNRASLNRASLNRASLIGASLIGASFNGASFYWAKIEESIKIKFFPLVCPETGAFIGYKKAAQNLVVKLQIPDDAKRSSAYGRKCRCDKALVLGIYDMGGNETRTKQVTSKRNEDFVYEVGQTVSVPDFDDDRWHECSTGIHFFITFVEAANYI